MSIYHLLCLPILVSDRYAVQEALIEAGKAGQPLRSKSSIPREEIKVCTFSKVTPYKILTDYGVPRFTSRIMVIGPSPSSSARRSVLGV